ncbi:MAG TPA: AzlC family ABC transporter permease [Anaerolineales bacterium]|nr:AzlC family ABC transporter permease [Anaerolineales bacterium]
MEETREFTEAQEPATSKRAEFLAGLKAELPLALGVIPFGMIYGVVALGAGLSQAAAQGMSSIIFAGSAQFISAQLFGLSAPAIIVVMTVAVVNLRHVLYSASLAPYVQALPARWKWLLAYLLTDEAYAVTITRYNQPDGSRQKHWFFLASGLLLWATWQASTAAGIFLGAAVPASWSLDFTLALTFIGIVVPMLRDRPGLGAALTAGLVAVATSALPYKLGLLAAALAGILVGAWLERRA